MIYRPGDITGSEEGIWEVDDMVSRVITGSIQMRSIPRTSYCMHMTPVDYVADALPVFPGNRKLWARHLISLTLSLCP